tara:strand:+ start:99 stop:254 length:156 start_codon:yes stop_codon:yes gene_type:complete
VESPPNVEQLSTIAILNYPEQEISPAKYFKNLEPVRVHIHRSFKKHLLKQF